ncbi:MAG: glycosyltransferase family 4 protein [Flavitalea sp.]
MSKNALFLYTEIADYFLKCVDHFIEQTGAQVLIVRWPIRDEAPFKLRANNNVDILEKKDYTFKELEERIHLFQPDLIYTSGWRDRDYLKINRKYFSKIPTVLGYDNVWNGSFRQIIASALSPLYLKKIFSDLWAPGKSQVKFAKKLGFDQKHIHLGVYSCNQSYFSEIYSRTKKNRVPGFPRRMIFCARYVKWKGIFELWQAFKEISQEIPHDWELWCLGTGEEFENRIEYPGIKHFGFVQPNNMEEYLSQTGVYILPSFFEPWGVTAHEFAAAGFPLILTKNVGASEKFLIDNHNGFCLPDCNVAGIKESMRKIFKLSDAELFRMGEISNQLSYGITPDTWSITLQRLINRNQN